MKQDEEKGEQAQEEPEQQEKEEQTEETPLLKEEKAKEKEDKAKEKPKETKKAKEKSKEKPRERKMKSKLQVAKEEGVLLARPFGIQSEDDVTFLPEEDPTKKDFYSCIAANEPLTKDYRAGNPTPLLLLAIHLGNSIMALLQLFGAWAFITINAQMIFPNCKDHRALDAILGTNSGHGWLCEIASLAFWTFPLVCGLFVPFFHYWDFCDTRLFYESLRNNLLVHFTQTPFITNACVIYLIVHFLVGMCMFIFVAREKPGAMLETLKAVLPALIPLITFFIQTYVTWDIKFFLITLAKYTDDDPGWAKDHLLQCLSASEAVVMEAYKALGKKSLPVDSSNEMFTALHDKVQELKDKNDADIEDGKPPHEYVETSEALPWDRIQALLFYQDGFWTLDMLWLPKDMRGCQFRYSFRTFAFSVYVLEALFIWMITCTWVTYMWMQGHPVSDSTSEMFSLEPFMLSH